MSKLKRPNTCKIFFLMILSFLFHVNFTSAENIEKRFFHWEFAGWFGGGFYPNTAFDPNIRGRVYLVSDVAGIWKSDDLGENWIPINNGLDNLIVSFLGVAPSDSNILYAGTSIGLFRSFNQGKSWRLCSTNSEKINFKRPDNYRSIAISGENPNKLVIGTQEGELYFSDNFGDSWVKIEMPEALTEKHTHIPVVQFDNNEKGVYFSLAKDFYYYSLESQTWKLLKSSTEEITDFLIIGDKIPAVYLAGEKFLLISKDNGKSWFSSSNIPNGITYRVAAFKSGKNNIIAVAWNRYWQGGIYLSNDNGKTWEGKTSNFKFDESSSPTRAWTGGDEKVVSLKVNPFDSSVLFATTSWGVFRSDDGGHAWREKIRGAPNTVGSDIHITADGQIYVATMDNGLLKSTDGGKTYKSLFPKSEYNIDVNGHVWRVITNPKDPKNVILTSSPWNVDANQVAISKNSGRDFLLVRDGLPAKRPRENTMWEQGFPRAIALDLNQPWLVYLGIDGDDGGGLFISHDAGWHWKYSKGQPGSRRIYNALVVDPTNSDRIVWGGYGENGGIYISEDRGESWQYVFNRMTKVFDISISPKGWIYAAGNFDGPAVFISKDHGQNWSLLNKFSDKGAADGLLIHPNNPNKMAVSAVQWFGNANGKIFESNDAGESWQEITGDLPHGEGAAAMAYNPKDSCLYITRYAGSVYKTKW
ncbi:WD40/YVTN/BNR-like repeat-containing protein [Candidatus Omnitrophota bacterium]